jgi:hypothetical protein
MQISQVKQEELAVLIAGLRAVWITDEEQAKVHAKLLKQLENELSQRFGMMLPA